MNLKTVDVVVRAAGAIAVLLMTCESMASELSNSSPTKHTNIPTYTQLQQRLVQIESELSQIKKENAELKEQNEELKEQVADKLDTINHNVEQLSAQNTPVPTPLSSPIKKREFEASSNGIHNESTSDLVENMAVLVDQSLEYKKNTNKDLTHLYRGAIALNSKIDRVTNEFGLEIRKLNARLTRLEENQASIFKKTTSLLESVSKKVDDLSNKLADGAAEQK